MTHDPRSALLRAAVEAAERGWPVFPLRPGTKRPALHREDRCPGTGPCAAGHLKWEQRATTDPARIRAAWSIRPFNVGIATGPAALVVIDLDRPKNGSDTPCGVTTFRALCERAEQPVPATRRVRTANGGEHLYFTAPAGARLGNTARRLGAGIDTRAHGGYVVAPGSILPTGAYEVIDPAPVAPLPRWLHQALSAPRTSSRAPAAPVALPAPGSGRRAAYVAAALRNETTGVAAAPEGTRNRTLLRAARALGRLVATGELTRPQVEEALKAAGMAAGLRESECTPVITSALNWSITHNTPGRAA
ncbi:DNA primase [Streptomyces alkaliphilus]|uniref:DNA primase n=1 Tax=Streptomyces alkaliphilus TaxID=1472722 RepID=A0A7W3THG6_9ACTN|nr:bifunctional DNA primase/polymerase [Streptomyces alkaliphilus]MBB0246929.1 DNA primase [Streptomyces alkaliphilus]